MSPIQSFQANPEAVRQWANFFAPGMSSQLVNIPVFWSDFFTAQLLNPLSFVWVKEFLSSAALDYLHSGNGSVSFSIPDKCPSLAKPHCTAFMQHKFGQSEKCKDIVFEGTPVKDIASSSNQPGFSSQVNETSQAESISPATPMNDMLPKVSATPGPWSKALLQQASNHNMGDKVLSDEELRRSKRFHAHNQGYHNCIGCSVKPPNLTPSIIRNLGKPFAKQMAPSSLQRL